MEEFASGSVPVSVAAKVYGKDASWVRAGIISGWLPIGKASMDVSTSISLPNCCSRKRVMCGKENENEYNNTARVVGEKSVLD